MNELARARPYRLLGLYDSPFVRRVAITMTLYRIPFEHLSLSVFRDMEAMRPINPLFKVPLLTLPDGETLYESAYLLDHLDELASERGMSPLIPCHGAERRAVQQAAALAIIATEKAVALEYERKRPADLQWAAWSDRLRAQMRQAFGILEERLSGEFLIGGRLTQADVSTAVGIGFVRHVLPHEWPDGQFPALERLSGRLEASEAFRAVPIDG
ncbi:MAG TPA: glutathione S-transferase family protein [Accumulibacter sp.]|nr:glutathione S-transferase family protein [Accumulibacter sp.]HMW16793.1 glutathione S-transferase family protein [Accumulibacter sp.]HMX22816.1 glutathione S-transferase family protein [Accumulibacter sp.]HMY05995.1 glutathione S-transferase family protein [Accumulibacter sp.]HNC18474.1 glutathione S-transferase family protein [Accumulibacter sp.]